MRASIVTGCLMTAFAFAVAVPLRSVSAADLDGDAYGEQPYDEQESEPGYAEPDYGDERGQPRGRYSEAPPPDRYQEPYDEGGPDEQRPGSIKDGYPVPMPPPQAGQEPAPPRYADRPPMHADRPMHGDRYACLDRWQVKRRLRSEGWLAIRPMGGDGRVVDIRARRFDSSSPFHLRVDRCSGAVISAHPRRSRDFAYRDWRRDRRW